MKKLSVYLSIAGAILCSPAHAQLMIDMSRITCADYLAMNAADSAAFSAWMSGWFNQKRGYVFVDLSAYQRNVANLKSGALRIRLRPLWRAWSGGQPANEGAR